MIDMVLYFLIVTVFALITSYLAYSIERFNLAIILMFISGMCLVLTTITMIHEGYFNI